MAEEAKKKAEPTTFFILEERSDGLWHYRGKVVARDRDHAARLFYEEHEPEQNEEVTFVAISIAAWRPRVRKVAVKTTVTYGEVETFGVVPVEAEDPPADPALELVPPAAA